MLDAQINMTSCNKGCKCAIKLHTSNSHVRTKNSLKSCNTISDLCFNKIYTCTNVNILHCDGY